MRKIYLGKPQPKQDDFLKKHARHRAFGGARGGGKSWVARYTAKLYCLNYPGIRVCIVRKSYPELTQNHIERLMANSCDPLCGVIFTDMCTDLERCSDHAINIACALSDHPS